MTMNFFLVTVLLLESSLVYTSAANKDNKISAVDTHIGSHGNKFSDTFSDGFKNALRQFETYLSQETDNISNVKNEEQDEHNRDKDKKEKKPFIMNGGYNFDKRQSSRNENFLTDDREHYRALGDTDLKNENLFHEKKRPFVLGGGYSFGKRSMQDENLFEAKKRPFVMGGGYKFGKRSFDDTDFFNTRKRPFVLGGGYRFGKRSMQDEDLFEAKKRPFVMGGGYKFGKRSFDDTDFFNTRKRPFVLGGGYRFGKRSSGGDYLFEAKKRPFVLGGRYRLGKRLLNGEDFTDERKRPFVLGGGQYKFGKRTLNNRNSIDEEKRPFMFGNFGKYSPNDNYIPSADNLLEYVDAESYGKDRAFIKDSSPLRDHEVIDLDNESRVSKRPFIMGGGFNRLRKIPFKHEPTIRQHPMFVGSGFRFGKRNQWNHDQATTQMGDLPDSPPKPPADNINVFDIEDSLREKSSPNYADKYYSIHKKPYNGKPKRPMFIGGLRRQPPTTDDGFRFENEYNTMETNKPLDIIEKRPFVMNLGRRDHSIQDYYNKRYFTFRHDYHFDKLRQKAMSNVDQSPFIPESFRERRDPNELNYRVAQDEANKHYNSDMNTGEIDAVTDGNYGNYDILNLPFHPIKRHITTSGNYKSKIGKRPFVMNGGRSSYTFGK